MTFLRSIEFDRASEFHGPICERNEDSFYWFSARPSFHTNKTHCGHRQPQSRYSGNPASWRLSTSFSAKAGSENMGFLLTALSE